MQNSPKNRDCTKNSRAGSEISAKRDARTARSECLLVLVRSEMSIILSLDRGGLGPNRSVRDKPVLISRSLDSN